MLLIIMVEAGLVTLTFVRLPPATVLLGSLFILLFFILLYFILYRQSFVKFPHQLPSYSDHSLFHLLLSYGLYFAESFLGATSWLTLFSIPVPFYALGPSNLYFLYICDSAQMVQQRGWKV